MPCIIIRCCSRDHSLGTEWTFFAGELSQCHIEAIEIIVGTRMRCLHLYEALLPGETRCCRSRPSEVDSDGKEHGSASKMVINVSLSAGSVMIE